MGKNPKNLFGVFAQVKIGLKKILLQIFFFYKMHILSKDPKIAKKMVSSLENRNSQIFSLDFFNVDNFY